MHCQGMQKNTSKVPYGTHAQTGPVSVIFFWAPAVTAPLQRLQDFLGPSVWRLRLSLVADSTLNRGVQGGRHDDGRVGRNRVVELMCAYGSFAFPCCCCNILSFYCLGCIAFYITDSMLHCICPGMHDYKARLRHTALRTSPRLSWI